MREQVKVFWVCECDAVAALSLDDALQYYKDLTGLNDDELYERDEIEVEPEDSVVRDCDTQTSTITVKQILDEHWEGEPFIALTTYN